MDMQKSSTVQSSLDSVSAWFQNFSDLELAMS